MGYQPQLSDQRLMNLEVKKCTHNHRHFRLIKCEQHLTYSQQARQSTDVFSEKPLFCSEVHAYHLFYLYNLWWLCTPCMIENPRYLDQKLLITKSLFLSPTHPLTHTPTRPHTHSPTHTHTHTHFHPNRLLARFDKTHLNFHNLL